MILFPRPLTASPTFQEAPKAIDNASQWNVRIVGEVD
jgi:hypothetical protein